VTDTVDRKIITDVDDWHDTDRLHAEQGQGDPFAAAVRATRMAMLITDPRRFDNPIVYANSAFLRLTGYARDEVVGCNCRFLQGPDTDRHAIDSIREAIGARRDIAIDILNYRKDGSSFWNGLYLSPVTNSEGELQFFFASQLDVTDRVEAQLYVNSQREWLEREVSRRTQDLQAALAAKTMLVHEVDHRVKNNLQMISSLLAMQTRTIKDPEAKASLRGMLQRVEAIGTVHRRLYQSDDVQQFDLADFVRDIVGELQKASGRINVAIDLDLQSVKIPSNQASPVALVLNELVTNAFKHAFPDERAGRIAISIRKDGTTLRIVLRDDGIGLSTDQRDEDGFGRRLIKSLGRQLRAEIVWLRGNPGTIVEINAALAG
jgi:PAS domain S-box-containing protein